MGAEANEPVQNLLEARGGFEGVAEVHRQDPQNRQAPHAIEGGQLTCEDQGAGLEPHLRVQPR